MSRALEHALDELAGAADRVRRAGKRAKRPDAALAAVLVAGVAVALRGGKADPEELRHLIVLVAAWGAR